jgi:transposase
MSSKELRRAGVLARVESGELKLVNAAVIMGLSYRQSKRLGQRYREEGAEGLKHRSAGRESNRKKPKNFRERVLRLVAKKYSGELCQEDEKSSCCTRDGGGPSGAAL